MSPIPDNTRLQAGTRLVGGLYGAIFGLAGGTIIDWILLTHPGHTALATLISVTHPLPSTVVGALVGLATSSVGTLRRMLWGALIGLSIGAALRALLLAQMDGSDPAPWYSFENPILRVGVLWAAFAGPTFAWVAALAGALVSPPPWEAAELESLNGPCWRWRWTRARRELLLYGMARAARTGMLFWTCLGCVVLGMLNPFLFGQGYSIGAWFGLWPLSLLGGLILRQPSRAITSLGAWYGALSGLVPALGLLLTISERDLTWERWLNPGILIALAIFCALGSTAGMLVVGDLRNAIREAHGS